MSAGQTSPKKSNIQSYKFLNFLLRSWCSQDFSNYAERCKEKTEEMSLEDVGLILYSRAVLLLLSPQATRGWLKEGSGVCIKNFVMFSDLFLEVIFLRR